MMLRPTLVAQISDLHIKRPEDLAYGRVDTAAGIRHSDHPQQGEQLLVSERLLRSHERERRHQHPRAGWNSDAGGLREGRSISSGQGSFQAALWIAGAAYASARLGVEDGCAVASERRDHRIRHGLLDHQR